MVLKEQRNSLEDLARILLVKESIEGEDLRNFETKARARHKEAHPEAEHQESGTDSIRFE